MSPISSAVGPADPAATPTAVDTTPSMPLAPRLATTTNPGRGRHAAPRPGSASTTTRPAGPRRAGRRRRPGPRRARWGRPVRRPRRPAPSRPRPRPPASGPASPVRARRPAGPQEGAGVAVHHHRRGAGRVRPPGRPRHHLRRPRGGQPLVHDPRRAGRPQPQHPVGTEPVGGLGRAEDGVEVRHGGARRPPGRRPGLGHHGPAPGGGRRAPGRRPGPARPRRRRRCGTATRSGVSLVQIAAEGRRSAEPFGRRSSPGSRPAARGTGG